MAKTDDALISAMTSLLLTEGNRKVEVKIVDDRDVETLKVVALEN